MATSFPDLRSEFDDDTLMATAVLWRNWPCIPGETVDELSAFDCLVVLARAIWGTVKTEAKPKQSQNPDALEQYIWTYFKRTLTDHEQIKERMRSAAFAQIMEQSGTASPTFSEMCRGSMMVDTIWNHPWGSFLLRYPVLMAGFDAPGGRVIQQGAALAKEDVLPWDGVSPSTVTQLVNNVTCRKFDGRNTVYTYLNRPHVLQVDLVQSESRNSLLNLWRFQADVSVSEPVEDSEGSWRYRQEKKAYVILAIVRCRNPPHRLADNIRVFNTGGDEMLPDLAKTSSMPSWGFKLNDPIPVGERLHIFYKTVNSLDLPPPREHRKIIAIPQAIMDRMRRSLRDPAVERQALTASSGQVSLNLKESKDNRAIVIQLEDYNVNLSPWKQHNASFISRDEIGVTIFLVEDERVIIIRAEGDAVNLKSDEEDGAGILRMEGDEVISRFGEEDEVSTLRVEGDGVNFTTAEEDKDSFLRTVEVEYMRVEGIKDL
ncbi:hypothetical protein N0V82_005939 [Gnomoniopsis sp. IMI 355080]|nr:hypothetical protein N0V82_005939 [Gnomoniopsis sp. IMI 355080]